MNLWIEAMPLLAQIERYRYLGQQLRLRANRFDVSGILMLFVSLGIIVFGAWLLHRYFGANGNRIINRPRALFSELCKAHQLSWNCRHLLRVLAQQQALLCPSELFLRPDLFDAELLQGTLRGRREEIESLRDRIFGTRLESLAD